MSKIIGEFKGKVIKNIGDSLLYYFPSDSEFSEGNLKNCLNCGLAMLGANERIANDLISFKLPPLHYRISADFGSALMMNTNISNSFDLIGPPVTICSKINHCAKKDE